MFEIIWRSFILAILYRLRGAGEKGKTNLGRAVAKFNKWWFAVALAAFYAGDMIYAAKRIPVENLPDNWQFKLAVAVFYIFAAAKIACAVGRDVGPFYGGPAKTDNNFLDRFDADRFKDRPVLFCAYRLTVLGLFSGLVIGMATRSLWPILGGATMGALYWFGCCIIHQKLRWVKDGLAISEIMYGFVLGFFSVI